MKKYNPFKMWGSYVGAVSGFILQLNLVEATPVAPIFWTVVGFMAGWGSHSLIRVSDK